MSDLIDRQAAIDAMTECYWSIMGDEPPKLDEKTALYVDLKQAVKRLPTADLSEYSDKLWKTAYERGKAEARVIKLTEADKESLRKAMENAELTLVAEPRKGKWIPVKNGRGGHECDQCHEYAPSWQTGEERLTNYCPNCGARMEE